MEVIALASAGLTIVAIGNPKLKSLNKVAWGQPSNEADCGYAMD